MLRIWGIEDTLCTPHPSFPLSACRVSYGTAFISMISHCSQEDDCLDQARMDRARSKRADLLPWLCRCPVLVLKPYVLIGGKNTRQLLLSPDFFLQFSLWLCRAFHKHEETPCNGVTSYPCNGYGKWEEEAGSGSEQSEILSSWCGDSFVLYCVMDIHSPLGLSQPSDFCGLCWEPRAVTTLFWLDAWASPSSERSMSAGRILSCF